MVSVLDTIEEWVLYCLRGGTTAGNLCSHSSLATPPARQSTTISSDLRPSVLLAILTARFTHHHPPCSITLALLAETLVNGAFSNDLSPLFPLPVSVSLPPLSVSSESTPSPHASAPSSFGENERERTRALRSDFLRSRHSRFLLSFVVPHPCATEEKKKDEQDGTDDPSGRG